MTAGEELLQPENLAPVAQRFARQQAHLRLFAAAVDTFNGDECSSIVHELNVYRALV